MSCWQEQLSKFTVAVTLLLPLFKILQLQRALRKLSTGPHGRPAAHGEGNEPCLSWQTLPSRGTFAASAERPVASTLLGRRWFRGQDGLFPPRLPFRKHILPFLPCVFANGGKKGAWGTEWWSSAVEGWRLMSWLHHAQAFSDVVFAELKLMGLHVLWIKTQSIFISNQCCGDSVFRSQ